MHHCDHQPVPRGPLLRAECLPLFQVYPFPGDDHRAGLAGLSSVCELQEVGKEGQGPVSTAGNREPGGRDRDLERGQEGAALQRGQDNLVERVDPKAAESLRKSADKGVQGLLAVAGQHACEAHGGDRKSVV